MPIADDSLCIQTENLGEVSKAAGACCYVATVDNVNLLTGELTVTFTGAPPVPLPAQVIIPGANVRYNCGLCYTAGLGTNLPAFGFQRDDSVLVLIPNGWIPENGNDLSMVFVVGHEFASGAEDLKACGQIMFLPLVPSPHYGSPFLVEAVVDDVATCVQVNPHWNPNTGIITAIGTAGSSPYNLLYYSGGGVLRPYLLPGGGEFAGYRDQRYMIDDSHFDEGTRLVLSVSLTYAGYYYYPTATWIGQESRSIGKTPSLTSTAALSTGSEFTSSYTDRLFQSPLFLVSDGDINVPMAKANNLRMFSQQWDTEAKTVGYDGTYSEELLAPVCPPVASFVYTTENIPVTVTTFGIFRETLNSSSSISVDLSPWRAGELGVNISLAGFSSEAGVCEHTGTTEVNRKNYYISGQREVSEMRTYSLNGTVLGEGGYEVTMDYEQIGDGPDAGWRATAGAPDCSGAVPVGPAGDFGTITWTGAGHIRSRHVVFLMCDPLRDFAIFIRTDSSTNWNGSCIPNYHSAAWFTFPTGVYTASNSDIKTVTAELCIYSKGSILVIETYTDSSEADTTGSGNSCFNFAYFAESVSTELTGTTGCTYSGGEQYTKETWEATFTESNAADLLFTVGGYLYWPDGTYNIPIMGGYAPSPDGRIRFIETRSGTSVVTHPFSEYSCSDDGSLVWVVMNRMDGLGLHRLFVENGDITVNGESVLDEATGLEWNETTMKYCPVV